ncbi:hypothetical protein [Chryseobacterium binzhouense]|uniref:hypothetical protein n=1 Tax=Chryseobacterium binzhouense TaxID=2593646 RepID=UPI00117CF0CC|nr:hypothetical protein [Chryseobacterium binzhouense]
MLKKLIHKLFLPCSTATLLMEKSIAKTISSKEQKQLNIHLKICRWCRSYQEKLKILDDILKRKIQSERSTDSVDIQNFKEKTMKNLKI